MIRACWKFFFNQVPLYGNFELRPLVGRYGGTPSAWLVSEDTYVKTPPVGRRQPMTSLLARPQYKDRRENTSPSSSSSLTGLFEETGIQFSFIIMASTSKAFNKCVDPCPRYLRWHTQSLRLLFGQGARTRCPWGENLCATSSTFAGRRHMIGKVVTGCVAILPYHTATQDRRSECRDFGFISRIVTALIYMYIYIYFLNIFMCICKNI